MSTRTAVGVAVAAVALLAAATAHAQGLASPGPLSEAHARLDDLTRCLACHEVGRGLSGRRCLVCHASLARRIAAGAGFHADAAREGACGRCHSEHNGRPYRLVRWPGGSQERFDHRQAGWALDGAHRRQRCEACHRPELIADAGVRADTSVAPRRTFLGLSTRCATCHLDEHRGRVGTDCSRCHSIESWAPATGFDHDRTRFPLTGRHRGAPCASCHAARHQPLRGPAGAVDSSFVEFPSTRERIRACPDCHRSPHRDAVRFARCTGCHNTLDWHALGDSLRGFDHAPTGFPLRGAHARAPCESCHLRSATAPLPQGVALVRENLARGVGARHISHDRCDRCHAAAHAGQLPPGDDRDCDACHDETRFVPQRFAITDHARTAFPLTGAHAAVACPSCHPLLPGAAPRSGAVRLRIADRSCSGCHEDPHGGQFQGAACDRCHGTDSWEAVSFDHSSTSFPISGAHAPLPCDRCHRRPPGRPGEPVRFRGVATSCDASECHGDPHAGQFRDRARGSTCVACHSDRGWRIPDFDHGTRTDYPLDGAHRQVPCGACHVPQGSPPVVRYRPLPSRCEDCHSSHRGGST